MKTVKITKADERRMINALKRSPAYRVAYNDLDFLGEKVQRPIRLQLELLKPETIFKHQEIISTIVVFGGTRVPEATKAKATVKDLQSQLRRQPRSVALKKQLQIAKAIVNKSHYYEEARRFAQLVSTEKRPPHGHKYFIVTGGGPGIMEAANRGAWEVGAKSIGLNITLPMEQEPNAYITPELCIQFHYFAIRKMHFLLRAKALVAFPGGFGTLDELFEALTLAQTRKVKRLPIVLFGEKYWKRVIDFDYLVSEGTIDEKDLDLFVYCDHAEDAWKHIKDFYKGMKKDRKQKPAPTA